MKDPQQTADELVEMYSVILYDEGLTEIDDSSVADLKCAILDTQNTIDALKDYTWCFEIIRKIDHHQQVLKILKTRL